MKARVHGHFSQPHIYVIENSAPPDHFSHEVFEEAHPDLLLMYGIVLDMLDS